MGKQSERNAAIGRRIAMIRAHGCGELASRCMVSTHRLLDTAWSRSACSAFVFAGVGSPTNTVCLPVTGSNSTPRIESPAATADLRKRVAEDLRLRCWGGRGGPWDIKRDLRHLAGDNAL